MRTTPHFIAALCLFCLNVSAQESDRTGAVPPGVSVTRDLEFSKLGNKPQLLDIYLPKTASKKPLPLVIWVHGGGWMKGSKSFCPVTWITESGYALASIDYRLVDEAQWPAQIDDCHAAVRWLRNNAERFNLDKNRFIAWGGSAGGHLAALMGTLPAAEVEKVQASIVWYGASDLLSMPQNVPSPTRTREDLAKSNGALLLGGIVMDQPEKAKSASAIYQVTKKTPPFLLMHGDKDKSVPLEQSAKFFEVLRAAGIPSEFHIIAGAGHAGPEFSNPESRAIVTTFLKKVFPK